MLYYVILYYAIYYVLYSYKLVEASGIKLVELRIRINFIISSSSLSKKLPDIHAKLTHKGLLFY